MAETKYVNGTNIGTYHLADDPAKYEPSRNNAFEFLIDSTAMEQELGAKLKVAGINESEIADSDDYFSPSEMQEVIKISVAEASVPHFDLEVIEVKRGNSTMKFAGTPSFGEGSLKLNDYVGARTKDVLMAWRDLVYDVESDVVHLAGNYKFDCKLVEYNTDYSKVIRKWVLKGCWPKTISEGNFSHDSNDKRQIDVTIVYDRAMPDYDKTVTAEETTEETPEA